MVGVPIDFISLRQAPLLREGGEQPVGGRIATAGSSNSALGWVFLVGVFLPTSIIFWIGDSKITPGRMVVCLLLLPALMSLFSRARKFVASDFFVFATSAWMVGATMAEHSHSLSSAVAVVLEFSGGYYVTRGLFFSGPALHSFVQVLKFVAIVIVSFAALDHLSGTYLIDDMVSNFWGSEGTEPDFRNGLLRARSVFPHPILFGTFCAAAGAIFLYSESRHWIFFVGLCVFGCILSMSSAPVLSFSIALSVYFYDRILRRYSWRWKALMMLLGTMLLAVYLVANRPTSWVISNLTLDPSTGYFRQATWDRALYNIDLSPLTGYGFDGLETVYDFFDNASVDSIWLVLALRFGVPVVLFLLAAIAASFHQTRRQSLLESRLSPFTKNLRTGFTLAMIVLSIAGLTVHFWHSIWIFWGVCIGIRANLREYTLQLGPAPAFSG